MTDRLQLVIDSGVGVSFGGYLDSTSIAVPGQPHPDHPEGPPRTAQAQFVAGLDFVLKKRNPVRAGIGLGFVSTFITDTEHYGPAVRVWLGGQWKWFRLDGFVQYDLRFDKDNSVAGGGGGADGISHAVELGLKPSFRVAKLGSGRTSFWLGAEIAVVIGGLGEDGRNPGVAGVVLFTGGVSVPLTGEKIDEAGQGR